MKNWKTKLALSVVLCASTAQADISYRWVRVSDEQLATNKYYCDFKDDTDGAKALMSVGGLAGLTAYGILRDGGISDGPAIGITTGAGGAASVAFAAMELYHANFKADEILALIYELQSNRPGLMLEKLLQVALENNVSADRLLAGLNQAAVETKLCSHDGAGGHDKDLKDLVTQDRARVKAQADAVAANAAAEVRAQREKIEAEQVDRQNSERQQQEQAAIALQAQQEAAIAAQLQGK